MLPAPFEEPVFFLIFFVLMWLLVTTGLSVVSGWFRLMKAFPNRLEEPLAKFQLELAALGGVGMRSILRLSVCPSGMRVGILRLFGPFSRDFFVPWEAIGVTRKKEFFQNVGVISFGQPAVGTLSLPSEELDRIARAAGRSWPESGTFPPESYEQAGRRIFKQWALLTCFAATFFIVVPLIAFPNGDGPPVVVAILFPAIVFGIYSIIRYLAHVRYLRSLQKQAP